MIIKSNQIKSWILGIAWGSNQQPGGSSPWFFSPDQILIAIFVSNHSIIFPRRTLWFHQNDHIWAMLTFLDPFHSLRAKFMINMNEGERSLMVCCLIIVKKNFNKNSFFQSLALVLSFNLDICILTVDIVACRYLSNDTENQPKH